MFDQCFFYNSQFLPINTHSPRVLVFFANELPLKLQSVAHLYTTVCNTNCALGPPDGECTRVFMDKLKDLELARQQQKPKTDR